MLRLNHERHRIIRGRELRKIISQRPITITRKSSMFFGICLLAGIFYPALWAIAVIVYVIQLELDEEM